MHVILYYYHTFITNYRTLPLYLYKFEVRLSDKRPQNFIQVVGQMSVSDKCPCRTNVRLPPATIIGEQSQCSTKAYFEEQAYLITVSYDRGQVVFLFYLSSSPEF